MNQTYCTYAEIIIPILLFITMSLLGVALWWIKRYISVQDAFRIEAISKLDKAIQSHADCQASLPIKYASKEFADRICSKIDKVLDMIGGFHMVFRTKEEASREWRHLEVRLESIEKRIDKNLESR